MMRFYLFHWTFTNLPIFTCKSDYLVIVENRKTMTFRYDLKQHALWNAVHKSVGDDNIFYLFEKYFD